MNAIHFGGTFAKGHSKVVSEMLEEPTIEEITREITKGTLFGATIGALLGSEIGAFLGLLGGAIGYKIAEAIGGKTVAAIAGEISAVVGGGLCALAFAHKGQSKRVTIGWIVVGGILWVIVRMVGETFLDWHIGNTAFGWAIASTLAAILGATRGQAIAMARGEEEDIDARLAIFWLFHW